MRLVRRRPAPHDRLFVMPLVGHIALMLVTAMVLAVVLGVGLWWAIGQPSITTGKPWTAKETFDFVKIVLAIVGGIGAVVALVVSYRKQRLGEAAEAREDARLFGEDFVRATEQLGSTEAPVRLAGMYTLERLGQDTPVQQQTIVNVLCAYLRMPFTTPDNEPIEERQPKNEQHKQEREVRLTAQRILANNLRPSEASTNHAREHWKNIHLDLTGAVLLNFDLENCQLNTATFDYAEFSGSAQFDGVRFSGSVWFMCAQFDGLTGFQGARFGNEVSFIGANFANQSSFAKCQFEEGSWFSAADFIEAAHFNGATFKCAAHFGGVSFLDSASFEETKFGEASHFENAKFANPPSFEAARVRLDVSEFVSSSRTWPEGYAVTAPATSEERRLHGREGQWGYLTLIAPEGLPANELDNPGSSDAAAAN